MAAPLGLSATCSPCWSTCDANLSTAAGRHRTCNPRPHRASFTRALQRSVPLEDAEGAEAGGVGERLGFRDAASGPDGFEVTEVGTLGPHPASFFHQLFEAVPPQPAGLLGVGG